MFRLTREKNTWAFAAFGKHPSAGDYLSLGATTPLLKGFSFWMDKGYGLIESDRRGLPGLLWRFWAKGPNSKLICGVLKSSRDKHGRPYPLLIAGEGRVPDLTKDWDLIPFACARTWQILSSISERESGSIRHLKRVLSKIEGPVRHWDSYRLLAEGAKRLELPSGKNGNTSDFINKMNNVDGLSRKDHFSVRIDVGRPENCLVPVAKLLILLKNRSKHEPGTVFIGGNAQMSRLFFIKRSLMMDDFKTLWEAHCDEEML